MTAPSPPSSEAISGMGTVVLFLIAIVFLWLQRRRAAEWESLSGAWKEEALKWSAEAKMLSEDGEYQRLALDLLEVERKVGIKHNQRKTVAERAQELIDTVGLYTAERLVRNADAWRRSPSQAKPSSLNVEKLNALEALARHSDNENERKAAQSRIDAIKKKFHE